MARYIEPSSRSHLIPKPQNFLKSKSKSMNTNNTSTVAHNSCRDQITKTNHAEDGVAHNSWREGGGETDPQATVERMDLPSPAAVRRYSLLSRRHAICRPAPPRRPPPPRLPSRLDLAEGRAPSLLPPLPGQRRRHRPSSHRIWRREGASGWPPLLPPHAADAVGKRR